MTEVEKLAKAQREAIERRRNAVNTAIAFAVLAVLAFGLWKFLRFCWAKSPTVTLIGVAIVIVCLSILFTQSNTTAP